MSDTPNVLCPVCGKELAIINTPVNDRMSGQEPYKIRHKEYTDCPIGYIRGYWSETAAYAAATRRPPNKALTEAELGEKNWLDAIWLVDEKGYVWLRDGEKARREVYENPKTLAFQSAFAPTAADIEAARKESNV